MTSINLSYCKAYTRDVFRTQWSIYNKAFLWFSQRSSTIDVRPGSKYASAYIQVSPIEIICILNTFAVKYIFSGKSSSKWIKGNFISLYFILAYSYSRCRFIPSYTLWVKPNATYSTHFLVVLHKGFKRNRNSHYEIIKR